MFNFFKKDPDPWEVKGGELYFDGHVCRPTAAWTKSFLDERVHKMKELIAASPHPITIEVLYIEQHVAAGMFIEGTLTEEMLRGANDEYNGITFSMELDGAPMWVSIQKSTYYDSYEFIVRGHPTHVRVRPNPDLLGVIAGETSF